mmetsp:Transcript_54047/g.131205  ORF Transcript_54047/g.131205 Transcript_54047/m.131205 type:complete len:80 (-) Transcript_54047:1054-1293(-)
MIYPIPAFSNHHKKHTHSYQTQLKAFVHSLPVKAQEHNHTKTNTPTQTFATNFATKAKHKKPIVDPSSFFIVAIHYNVS